MRKLFFAIVLLLLEIQGYSQISGNSSDFSKMSEILPPPPNSAAIGKYGGIDVTLSTGAVAKSINLFNYTLKGLSIPVNLSYVSNGLKANEYASRAGMGWVFEAGGSISRTIYGKDDLVYTRKFPNPAFGQNADDPAFTDFLLKSVENGWDTEPDIYSFNFNGMSGRFVFDSLGYIVPIPASNFKFIYNPKGAGNPSGDIWNFQIITSDGVKYFFGGIGATEQTRKEGYGSPNFANFSLWADNVWHLNKILHPNGYEINFTYSFFEHLSKLGVSESMYFADPESSVPFNVNAFSSGCTPSTIGLYPQVPSNAIRPENSRTKGYLLSQIKGGDSSKVIFSYSTAGYPDKLITSITLYNSLGFRNKKYELIYDVVTPTLFSNSYAATTALPFLITIKQFGSTDATSIDYKLNYYDRYNLPKRLTFAQDHWGYFNGKSNSTLIPLPTEVSLRNWFSYANANRESDSVYAIKGMLSSIVYPTGGKDSIEYGANTVSEQKDVNTYQDAYQSIIGSTFNQYTSSSGTSFTINYKHKNTLYVNCNYIGSGQYDPLHDGGRIKIINNATSIVVKIFNFKPNTNTYVKYFDLEPGSYTLYSESNGVDIRTDATLKYISNSSPNIQDVNVLVGGLRVKKVLTFDGINTNPQVKKLYYGEINNLTKSSAKPLPKPDYFKYYEFRLYYVAPSNCVYNCEPQYKYYNHLAMYSSTINPMYIYNGGPVNYVNVVEGFGENFENGSIAHKYQIVPDLTAQLIRGDSIIGSPMTNTSTIGGRETEQVVFKRVSGQNIPISKKSYYYTDEPTRKYVDVPGWVINTKHDIPCYTTNASNVLVGPFPFMHEAFDVQRYYIMSIWSHPNQIKDTLYDQNGQPAMVTTTDNYFENEQHMLLTKSETNDSKNNIKKQLIKYPHDFSATGNVYDSMVKRNMLLPIEQKEQIGSTDLTVLKNNYDFNWFADKHLIALVNIELKKGTNPSEGRFRYYNYDNVGNPLELGKENDSKSAFIWDHRFVYPIAEVKNASRANVAYSSFEADGKGNWNYTGLQFTDGSAPTGLKVYNLNTGQITATVLSAGNYIVSYWSKNGAQNVNSSSFSAGRTINGGLWTYYQHNITLGTNGTVTVSGTGIIDELRLYPEKALMSTITYDPLIGTTTQCDVNNRIVSYEYDEFHRLILVRDQDEKILKKFCYNYQGQTENCNIFYNRELQLSVQKQCSGQYTGTYVTYIIPAQTYLSTIDTTDANQKAIDDLLANGPAYANALGSCIPNSTCGPSNCTGADKKCVYGVCETGIKVYTNSVQIGPHLWECTYHYEWSDGSWSQNYTEESPFFCGIE